ncbi:AAA family ATPase [Brevibacillus sp. NPDC058079]|uniref:AAA family ATPase n=1 Tax=Brevibacillus sp. NPDC058079 TaxID=3346330 RepID=UPI0036E291AB
MQCVFFWVKKHRNYVGQGFNFGGPLRFHFDEELKKMIVNSSPFHIEDFFVPDVREGKESSASTITNVTAIIGENGTGKSSLLEYIIRLFISKENREESESDHLIVFQNTEQFIVYHSPSLQFELINSLKVEVVKRPLTDLNQEQLPLPVYFSNIFDTRRMPGSMQLIDISTNRFIEGYFESEEQRGLSGYHMEETERQLRFIKSRRDKHADNISFKLPEKITVSVKEPEAAFLAFEGRKQASQHFGNYIRKCRNELTSFYDEYQIPKKLQYELASRVLDHVLQERHFFRQQDVLGKLNAVALQVESQLSNQRDLEQLEGHELLNTKLAILIEHVQKMVNPNNLMYRSLYHSYELLKLISEMNADVLEQERTFELPVTDERKTLERLINHYHLSVRFDSYLQFKWPGLSSGELALLNLYTRFYQIRNSVNRWGGSQSVMVLIDEGEAMFHPQWQKQLVLNLVTFLSDIFQGKQIQIVLTSNSPFIASDLPKTNVIFLKNVDGKTVSINELDDQHQTFAANIHTLLAHSFFLQDGLIGMFARKKINEVIDLLVNQGREEVMARKREIEAIISIIGEPLIKTKLIQLLQEKIALHGLSLEERVAALEERLLKKDGGGRS